MSAALRIGVIGTGFGARVVAPVFSAADGCDVVEVVSARDASAVAALCRRPDLDLVSVHSPPFLHAEHVELALAGRHAVLCDKPFGCNLGDAERMVAAAESTGLVALLNFEFRHEPARVHVRELLRAGTIGDIEHVAWSHFSSWSRVPLRPAGWLFERAAGGGWLGAWGSHALDTLRWWIGDLVVTRAELQTQIPVRTDAGGQPRPCDADDTFRAGLVTNAGATVAIDSTFAAAASVAPRVLLSGSHAVAEIVADRSVVMRCGDGSRDEWSSPHSGNRDPHLVAMTAWALVVRDAVRSGEIGAETPSFADGREVARLMDAVRRAAG